MIFENKTHQNFPPSAYTKSSYKNYTKNDEQIISAVFDFKNSENILNEILEKN